MQQPPPQPNQPNHQPSFPLPRTLSKRKRKDDTTRLDQLPAPVPIIPLVVTNRTYNQQAFVGLKSPQGVWYVMSRNRYLDHEREQKALLGPQFTPHRFWNAYFTSLTPGVTPLDDMGKQVALVIDKKPRKKGKRSITQQPPLSFGLPPAKKHKYNRWVLAIVVGLILLSLVEWNTISPQAWTVTHTYSGFHSEQTATFNAPDHWKLAWKCNPSSAGGTSFNFIVHAVNYDTGDIIYAVNVICDDTLSSGLADVYLSGNDYIDVTSQGAWSVSIQEPT